MKEGDRLAEDGGSARTTLRRNARARQKRADRVLEEAAGDGSRIGRSVDRHAGGERVAV